MKKLAFSLAIATGAVGLFQCVVQAQTAEPTTIEWTDVEMSFGPVQVGANTISRQGDAITFDAVIEYYARYNGNCKTRMIYRTHLKSFVKSARIAKHVYLNNHGLLKQFD